MTQSNDDFLLRNLSLDILLEVTAGREYIHIITRQVLDKYDYLDGKKKAFIKRLTAGTIERRIELDYVIDSFSKTKVNKMRPQIRCILEMAVYQIMFMDNVYDTAAVNNAVKLARKRGFSSLSGYVNGVLRSVSAGYADISLPDAKKEPVKYLSVKYSMPEFIVNLLSDQYGFDRCERILSNTVKENGVSVRIDENLDAGERKSLIENWKKDGAEVEESSLLPYAVRIKGSEGLSRLSGYAEGKFVGQDVSSMFVCHFAGIKPGDTVIDVCAAPGGKSMHALAKLKNKGEVISCDVSEFKVAGIRENFERIPYDNYRLEVADASVNREEFNQKADVLLADVPCSGLGVMSKKQDIKYRIDSEALEQIVMLQRRILSNVQNYVRPGGTLVYSTCTINREENNGNLKWLCDNYGFETRPLENVPEELAGCIQPDNSLLLTGEEGNDGFFIAVLKKK